MALSNTTGCVVSVVGVVCVGVFRLWGVVSSALDSELVEGDPVNQECMFV